MRLGLVLVGGLLLAGSCKKKGPEAIPDVDGSALVESARARPVPDRLQARFQIRLKSKPLDLSGTTGGGLQVDRPGRGRIVIFGPIGGTLATLQSDGEGMAATVTKDRTHLLARDGEALLREATGGAAGVDDLLALLIGDMPFDDATVRSATPIEGAVRATLEGPDGIIVEADLDPDGSLPIQLVARDKQKSLLLEARYEGWTSLDGQQLPERVEVLVPAVDLSVNVRYQGWSRIEGEPSFDLATPDGYREASLEQAVRDGVKGLSQP